MRVEFLNHPEGNVIGRENGSDGEFYLRADGSVWYRNALAPGDECFVNASQADFGRAVDALHRYVSEVVTTEVEEEQMALVRTFESELQALGFLSGPSDSFWPLIVEQAHNGMQ